MIFIAKNPWLRKSAFLLALWVVALHFLPFAVAADDATNQLLDSLKGRQQQVLDSFTQLDFRVKDMDPNDPRTETAKAKLTEAQNAKDTFVNLKPENYIDPEKLPEFDKAEQTAIDKMNAVNRYLMQPVQPGAKKVGQSGSVPQGNLTEDFLPQVIRLLFRFTSLMILVSFVVSGVMFVIAFDNEEYVTKAKRMLYYSLVGFAFVTLAYAIVKGITNVNYFGLI